MSIGVAYTVTHLGGVSLGGLLEALEGDMKTTADFLDALRAKLNLPSDGRLADHLGLHRQYMSEYRTQKTTFNDEMAMKIADILEIDPVYVVACMHAQRAKRAEEKTLWERIASMTVAASVVAVVSGLALILSGGAMSLEGLNYGALAITSDLSGLYIMRYLDIVSVLNWTLFAAFIVALFLSLRDYHSSKKMDPRKEAHHSEV